MLPKKSMLIGKVAVDPKSEELYRCAMNQEWEQASELIKNGALGNYRSAWGRTALHSALYENHVKSAPGDFFEQLVKASTMVVNSGTDSGNTPLHWACTFSTTKEISVLLLYGADAKIKNKAGLTALDIAKEKGNQEMIKMLTSSN